VIIFAGVVLPGHRPGRRGRLGLSSDGVLIDDYRVFLDLTPVCAEQPPA
jgi:hypothetical protein